MNTVRGKDGAGSNLLNISMGPHLSDALLSSAIIQVRADDSTIRQSLQIFYKKWAIPGLFFRYFRLFNAVDSK